MYKYECPKCKAPLSDDTIKAVKKTLDKEGVKIDCCKCGWLFDPYYVLNPREKENTEGDCGTCEVKTAIQTAKKFVKKS